MIKGVKKEYPEMTFEEIEEMVRIKNEEIQRKNKEESGE